MIYRLLFALSLMTIGISCVIAARIVIRRPLKPFTRNLLIALIEFELILAALHLFAVTGELPPFWRTFFNMQYEMNLPTVFSSLQLMVIALAAFVSGCAPRT
jgi:hypothetical protein